MSDCYSYHHFYYYYGCDSHYDSSSDLNSYDPNPRQINEITFWKKAQKWPTGMTREVTHGSDPRWVTSAPGGPKNLLIDHHNNNAAVARSARRKKNNFSWGDSTPLTGRWCRVGRRKYWAAAISQSAARIPQLPPPNPFPQKTRPPNP